MRKAMLNLVLASGFVLACSCVTAQTDASPHLPAFDAATIKPPDPTARYQKAGFYGEVGGRVFFGGNMKMLVEEAFNLQDYQVAGAADSKPEQWFEINAVPPENSPSRTISVPNAEPTSEQRLMLQSLLAERFGFKYHFETKPGKIYILTRGTKPLQLKPPSDTASDPRAIIFERSDGDGSEAKVNGEAEGINTSTDYLALRLSRYLQLPVLNQTGITGSYDFHLLPDDPGNHDLVAGVMDVVDRLGLKLKRGTGPVQTLVIDHVSQPSEN